MKTQKMPYAKKNSKVLRGVSCGGGDDEFPNPPKGTQGVDYKEGADEILKLVDKQLRKFGLEVIMYDNQDDGYYWNIQSKENNVVKLKK